MYRQKNNAGSPGRIRTGEPLTPPGMVPEPVSFDYLRAQKHIIDLMYNGGPQLQIYFFLKTHG